MPTQRPIIFPLLRGLFFCACAGLPSAVCASDDPGPPAAAPVEEATRLLVADEIAPPVMTRTPPGALLQPAPQRAALPPMPEPAVELHDDFPRLATIDLTVPPDDLWQRMRNGFSMPDLDSPLVVDRQAWYLNRPEMLRRVLDRSRRYLYYIVGELEKRGMPTELALLPIVESSYNPMAYSRARASGIWQFIPSTGKTYRLEQNWWHDQRRDIIASTGAALDYLQAIYEMHGDWHLALASYNWGENAVARAISKNQAKHLPTDFAHLNMPGETRYYVPKLQALKNIIARPQLFGINIDPIPNQPYFDTVGKPADIDVTLAARLAEMPLDEFLALNPSYNRPVMPASNGGALVLPADKVETFRANLQSHEAQEKPLSSWRTYTLRSGERLDQVAARFGLSASRLKQINGITAKTKVGPGTALLVPNKNAPGNATLLALNVPQLPAASPSKAHRHGKAGTRNRPTRATRSGGHGKKAAQAHGKSTQPSAAGKKRTAPASHGASAKKHKKH